MNEEGIDLGRGAGMRDVAEGRGHGQDGYLTIMRFATC